MAGGPAGTDTPRVATKRTRHLVQQWVIPADLLVYLLGVRTVASGLPLYDLRAPNGDPFTYPPFAVLVMWPLSWVPTAWVGALWTAGTLVVLVLTVVVLARRCSARWPLLVGGVVLFVASSPSRLNLELGQVSAVIVLLVLVDVLDVTPARLRGVPLGVAAAIKLTPLLFVVYLLVSGRSRDGWRALATFAGCGLLAFAVLPRDSVAYWTDAVFHMTDRLGYLDYVDNQSVRGFLLRAGLPDVLWPVLAGVVVVIALYQAGKLARVPAALVVGCAGIVASPISWGHHLFWVVLAGLWMVWSARPAVVVAGTAVLAVMTLPPAMMPGNTRLAVAALVTCGLVWWAARATPSEVHLVSPGEARGDDMGDREDDFVQFVEAHAADLRRSAFLMCGDWHRAQDLTQSALLKLFVAWPRLERTGGLLTYARTTLVRTAVDESRRFWHRERATEALPEAPVTDVAPDASVDVLRALARLPARQRATVVLRYWEDLPVEDVAKLLGCGQGTVKSQAARGLAALREMVDNDGLLEGHR
jgi:RNA polymerase sigma-70 factor (sigma-E family)